MATNCEFVTLTSLYTAAEKTEKKVVPVTGYFKQLAFSYYYEFTTREECNKFPHSLKLAGLVFFSVRSLSFLPPGLRHFIFLNQLTDIST